MLSRHNLRFERLAQAAPGGQQHGLTLGGNLGEAGGHQRVELLGGHRFGLRNGGQRIVLSLFVGRQGRCLGSCAGFVRLGGHLYARGARVVQGLCNGLLGVLVKVPGVEHGLRQPYRSLLVLLPGGDQVVVLQPDVRVAGMRLGHVEFLFSVAVRFLGSLDSLDLLLLVLGHVTAVPSQRALGAAEEPRDQAAGDRLIEHLIPRVLLVDGRLGLVLDELLGATLKRFLRRFQPSALQRGLDPAGVEADRGPLADPRIERGAREAHDGGSADADRQRLGARDDGTGLLVGHALLTEFAVRVVMQERLFVDLVDGLLGLLRILRAAEHTFGQATREHRSAHAGLLGLLRGVLDGDGLGHVLDGIRRESLAERQTVTDARGNSGRGQHERHLHAHVDATMYPPHGIFEAGAGRVVVLAILVDGVLRNRGLVLRRHRGYGFIGLLVEPLLRGDHGLRVTDGAVDLAVQPHQLVGDRIARLERILHVATHATRHALRQFTCAAQYLAGQLVLLLMALRRPHRNTHRRGQAVVNLLDAGPDVAAGLLRRRCLRVLAERGDELGHFEHARAHLFGLGQHVVTDVRCARVALRRDLFLLSGRRTDELAVEIVERHLRRVVLRVQASDQLVIGDAVVFGIL